MRIISWNINGLKSRFDDLRKLILSYSPELVCLQKVRCSDERNQYQLEGYKQIYSKEDMGNWSGVMTYAKISVLKELESKEGDFTNKFSVPLSLSREGHLQVFNCKYFLLVNAYVPFANPNIENAERYREDWDNDFKDYIKYLSSNIPVIICGDFNVVHTEKDTCEIKLEKSRPCFTQEERQRFNSLLSECKLFDAFRTLNPEDTTPSFYGNFRKLGIGNRLDYFLISESIKDKILSCQILNNFSEAQSDPIMLEAAPMSC